MAQGFRPTRADINLVNLRFNLESCRAFLGHEIEVMPVVKANAYGHGAVPCALTLESSGVRWLGVATPEEGIELREAGVKCRILVFGGFWPGQAKAVISNRLTPAIFRKEQIDELTSSLNGNHPKFPIHLKIDTGMGRVGVRPDDLASLLVPLKSSSNLILEGVMSHLAVADDLSRSGFTEGQVERLDACLSEIEHEGFNPELINIANSPGAVCHSGARKRLVRLGGIIYGLGGDVLPAGPPAPELRPVMRVTSRLSDIKRIEAGESVGYGLTFTATRPTVTGLVPIGYHDGLPRNLSNIGSMLVRGVHAPILGRVSMDWTVIDLTDIPDAAYNDEVVVIGRDGDFEIRPEDIAIKTGTISYEITCGISDRVPRFYDQG
jgi:alanine racemase